MSATSGRPDTGRRRRWRTAARLLPAMLVATLLTVVDQQAAMAGEPSVPLPSTASTPVSQQQMGARPPDQAASSELHGNQPAGTAKTDGGGTSQATPLSPSATCAGAATTRPPRTAGPAAS